MTLHDAITDLIERPVSDAEAIDVIGEVRHAEQRLAEYRRGLMSETPPGDGERYALVEANSSVPSFNEHAIFSSVMDRFAMDDIGDVIRFLYEQRVIELKWTRTKLESWMRLHDISIHIAQHEVGPGDAEHIGLVWKQSLRLTERSDND